MHLASGLHSCRPLDSRHVHPQQPNSHYTALARAHTLLQPPLTLGTPPPLLVQVSASQIHTDLMTPKFAWDHPGSPRSGFPQRKDVDVVMTPEEALSNAHALCVLTEWDEFKTYDYKKIYDGMIKPAFIFDGRNILDHDALRKIGFVVYALGKPLDDFIRKANH